MTRARVPAVYLRLAFSPLLPLLPFHRINKLRIINRRSGFESHPLRQRKLSSPVKPFKNITFVHNFRTLYNSPQVYYNAADELIMPGPKDAAGGAR